MMKMEIHLDEKKIIADDVYDLDKMYEVIDQVFEICKLIKTDKGIYYGRGDNKDFAHIGAAVATLIETDWFMECVDKWLWYDSDSSNDPENFDVENLMVTYKDMIKEIRNG